MKALVPSVLPISNIDELRYRRGKRKEISMLSSYRIIGVRIKVEIFLSLQTRVRCLPRHRRKVGRAKSGPNARLALLHPRPFSIETYDLSAKEKRNISRISIGSISFSTSFSSCFFSLFFNIPVASPPSSLDRACFCTLLATSHCCVCCRDEKEKERKKRKKKATNDI